MAAVEKRISLGKVALMALGLATAIAVLVARPSLASNNTKAFAQLAQPLLAAADQWRDRNPEGCPTIGVLVREGFLDSNIDRVDPWGGTLRLVCSERDRITVLSPGKDGQLGTDDDLEWPER